MEPQLIIIIVNTVLWLIGFVPALSLQGAAAAGSAGPGARPFGAAVAAAGLIFPAVPIVSVVGSWTAYLLGTADLALLLAALPWVYLVILGVAIGLLLLRIRPE